MATKSINGKVFNITVNDGEVFFQHVDGALHTNTLKAVVRQLFDRYGEVKVFDTKNGVISFYGDKAVFWAKVDMETDIDKQMDLMLACVKAA